MIVMARGEKNFDAVYYQLLRDAERGILRDFLNACNGSMTEAAKMLGISLSQVLRRAKSLGGVLPDEPRREPFTPDEKRQDDDPSSEDDDHDDGRSADSNQRTTDHVDAS